MAVIGGIVISSNLAPGTEVEVLTVFRPTSLPEALQVASIDGGRYRIRRRSDGVVLPGTFPAPDVRPRR